MVEDDKTMGDGILALRDLLNLVGGMQEDSAGLHELIGRMQKDISFFYDLMGKMQENNKGLMECIKKVHSHSEALYEKGSLVTVDKKILQLQKDGIPVYSAKGDLTPCGIYHIVEYLQSRNGAELPVIQVPLAWIDDVFQEYKSNKTNQHNELYVDIGPNKNKELYLALFRSVGVDPEEVKMSGPNLLEQMVCVDMVYTPGADRTYKFLQLDQKKRERTKESYTNLG